MTVACTPELLSIPSVSTVWSRNIHTSLALLHSYLPSHIPVQLEAPSIQALYTRAGDPETTIPAAVTSPPSSHSADLLDFLTDPDTKATVFVPITLGLSNVPTDRIGDVSVGNEVLRYHIFPEDTVFAETILASEEPIVVDSYVTDDAKAVCESTLQITGTPDGVDVMGVPVVEADI